MSITVEEPQRAPAGPSKLRDTTKGASKLEHDKVDNHADVKKDAEPTQVIHKDVQNDKSGHVVPRIVMAYIPASAPASPAQSHCTPAPGYNTPETSHGERNPSTPDLATKLNQAFDEYRAREERLGDLGQEDQHEGYEGDANSPGEQHQGCCEHEYQHHAAHGQHSPEYQQHYYYDGHSMSPLNNAQWGWSPYHSASSSQPLYMQPSFQQEQYPIPHYQPDTSPRHPHGCSSPYMYSHHPPPFPHHYQHLSSIPPHPPPHPFAPSPPTHPSDPRITGTPFSPYTSPYISPYTSPLHPHPHTHPHPHLFPSQQPPQHPHHVTDLLQRLHFIRDQLNALDATHEIEIWRHGKYNFHRRRAKHLRKIKREKVEEMVTVVRELRALGCSVGRGQSQQQEVYCQPLLGGGGPGMGYRFGLEQQQWAYGNEGHWPGYAYGQEQEQEQWYGPGHGQSGSWLEVDLEVGNDSGCCGCGDDSAHTDSPEDNSAFESSMACECECGTTVDGEATLDSASEPASPFPDSSKHTQDVVNTNGTGTGSRSRTLSLPLDTTEKPSEQVQDVEAHEQQPNDKNENKQDEDAEKNNNNRERAGSWSGAEAVISEELRGIWRRKMTGCE